MMGRLKSDQGQLFYEFCLGDAVPEDHLVRKIDAALDLSWLRSELTPHYSSMGRPSIDPELMMRSSGGSRGGAERRPSLDGPGCPPRFDDRRELTAKRAPLKYRMSDTRCAYCD